jgi:hypothetical protein
MTEYKKVIINSNHNIADNKADPSVFLFFPSTHFLKTILANRTNGTFGFDHQTNRPFAKPKEPFFLPPHNLTDATKSRIYIYMILLRLINQKPPCI